jgi:hypothetical protein
MKLVAEGKDPMNTFRDPATNVAIHVATEADDPTWRQPGARDGAVSTGNSGKYSPITQARARKSGFAVPEGVPDYVRKVAASGAIHPRE